MVERFIHCRNMRRRVRAYANAWTMTSLYYNHFMIILLWFHVAENQIIHFPSHPFSIAPPLAVWWSGIYIVFLALSDGADDSNNPNPLHKRLYGNHSSNINKRILIIQHLKNSILAWNFGDATLSIYRRMVPDAKWALRRATLNSQTCEWNDVIIWMLVAYPANVVVTFDRSAASHMDMVVESEATVNHTSMVVWRKHVFGHTLFMHERRKNFCPLVRPLFKKLRDCIHAGSGMWEKPKKYIYTNSTTGRNGKEFFGHLRFRIIRQSPYQLFPNSSLPHRFLLTPHSTATIYFENCYEQTFRFYYINTIFFMDIREKLMIGCGPLLPRRMIQLYGKINIKYY